MVQPTEARQPAGWFNRLWTRLADLKLSQLSQLGVLFVLAGTALFGGLDTVDRHATPADPGAEFSDGQFTVAINRASLVPELVAGKRVIAPAEPGLRYLGVVTRLRNDGTIPGTLRNELDLLEHPDAEHLGSWRLSDGERVGSIGPGLTEDVAFVWSLPEGAVRPGDSVTLRVWKKKFAELRITYGKEWVSTDDYVHVTVPVQVPS